MPSDCPPHALQMHSEHTRKAGERSRNGEESQAGTSDKWTPFLSQRVGLISQIWLQTDGDFFLLPSKIILIEKQGLYLFRRCRMYGLPVDAINAAFFVCHGLYIVISY
jgi:hypothetical protein